MRKIALVLLATATLGCHGNSCNPVNNNKGFVVSRIETSEFGCTYSLKVIEGEPTYFFIKDKANKYKIGDTLRLALTPKD